MRVKELTWLSFGRISEHAFSQPRYVIQMSPYYSQLLYIFQWVDVVDYIQIIKFELRIYMSTDGGRRIVNVGAHGASNLLNNSFNQRMHDPDDLNHSGNRFDQNFGLHPSHDLSGSANLHSSRQAVGQADLAPSQLRHSNTDILPGRQGGVTFASTAPQNKHQQFKPHLERIDESNKSGSPHRKKGSREPSLSNHHLKASASGQNLDLSHLTVHSNRLEDSVKAPGRPPMRIDGLTQFLVDEHYKSIGVFTKSDKELFKFWKDYVSSVYRHQRRMALLKKSMGPQPDFAGSLTLQDLSPPRKSVQGEMNLSPSHPFAGQAPFQTLEKSRKALYKQFSKLYEMDVAYTLQKDLEHEADELKKKQLFEESKAKEEHLRAITEQEEGCIKQMIDFYYVELAHYFTHTDGYKPENEAHLLRIWHHNAAILQLRAQGIQIVEKRPEFSHSPGKENQSANREDPRKEQPELTEEQKLRIQKEKEEESKKEKELLTKEREAKDKKDKETFLTLSKTMEPEKIFLRNLFLMLRSLNVMTNNPRAVARYYRDQKDKHRYGIVWPREEEVEKIINRFFSPECVLRRVQLLFEFKRKTEGKHRHLSLFGFYLQLTPHQRMLYLVDYPYVRHPKDKPIPKYRVDKDNFLEQLRSLEFLTDESASICFETLACRYDLYVKLLVTKRRTEAAAEKQKRRQIHHDGLLESVFGKERKLKLEQKLKTQKTEQRMKELAVPKDKWKRLKILMNLKKKFTHDITLQKMINEELKTNRVFKYPEEYDRYDDQEDLLCKHMGDKTMKRPDDPSLRDIAAQAKGLREKFKVLDDKDLYYVQREMGAQKRKENEMQQFLIQHALQYLQEKKQRLQGKRTTVRQFVSQVYHEMVHKFPEISKSRFPHVTYGTTPGSETYKKSFPSSFKIYFFRLIKSYFQQKKGLKRMRQPAPTFILGPGKRCLLHTEFACPADCTYATFNKKVVLRSVAVRRVMREPQSFRARVWRRHDFRTAVDKVLMLSSEQENCTFEPEAGSMSRTIDIALRANPNMKRDDILAEPDTQQYMEKLGKNFHKAHPEVYKAGVLKRAHLMYREGRFEDALKRLYEGFNVESIKKRFDPFYMRRFMAEALLKAKKERQSKEREEKKAAEGGAKQTRFSQAATLNKIEAMKDEPESQKKRPEEDFENKKLIPILKEAFDLIDTIETRKKKAEEKIRKIRRQQSRTKLRMRSFSQYKRSQTRLDSSKPEKILYRSIMCPLKDKCPRDQRPRWPTSNTKAVTKFGQECPYAHHPMELRFPETIFSKLSAGFQTIKHIKGQIDTAKPKEVFKPAGGLFECVGCNSKSGKHIGGPCNLCRYKEMAKTQTDKFNDKQKKESLRKSMDKRVMREEHEDTDELHKIAKLLDLDNNYTLKFGLLKKACVLFFYGRINDAFDEVAKAAKIIQDQREIEKQKQQVIEKRWKFKLGMDDGFELPLPIDQLDPNKVDEAFLKKLDLQGVAVSTLKLYIQEVAPQGREEFSKHQFLNKCVEDFYLQCESKLLDKQKTIKKMGEQVAKLEEEADLMENGLSSPEHSPEKPTGKSSSRRKSKSKKLKMCPNLMESGKCTLPSYKCPYAHNPIQLDLIPVETKMKNLQGVIQAQNQKLKNMKPLEPWKPVKSGEVIHTHLMDMSTKNHKRKNKDGEEDEDDEKRRKEVKKPSIFDRENIFRKPYEVNE